MYSLVFSMAVDVNRPVLLVETLAILGFIFDNVEVVFAELDLKIILVIINNTFVLFKDLHFFL